MGGGGDGWRRRRDHDQRAAAKPVGDRAWRQRQVALLHHPLVPASAARHRAELELERPPLLVGASMRTRPRSACARRLLPLLSPTPRGSAGSWEIRGVRVVVFAEAVVVAGRGALRLRRWATTSSSTVSRRLSSRRLTDRSARAPVWPSTGAAALVRWCTKPSVARPGAPRAHEVESGWHRAGARERARQRCAFPTSASTSSLRRHVMERPSREAELCSRRRAAASCLISVSWRSGVEARGADRDRPRRVKKFYSNVTTGGRRRPTSRRSRASSTRGAVLRVHTRQELFRVTGARAASAAVTRPPAARREASSSTPASRGGRRDRRARSALRREAPARGGRRRRWGGPTTRGVDKVAKAPESCAVARAVEDRDHAARVLEKDLEKFLLSLGEGDPRHAPLLQAARRPSS